MNLKQLKPKLNFIAKNMRPILTQIKVTKNALECTDLETYVKIKNDYGMSEGLQNYTTLGLVNSSNDVTDYPMNNIDRDHRDVLNIDMSKLERCLQFASKDETRLYLNGVAVNDGHLVATDGHTMKAYELGEKFEHDYILPSTSLKVLIKLLKGYKLTGLVKLELNEQWATVDNAQFTFSMRLIQRDYPKWQAIVPTSYAHEVIINNFDILKDAAPLFKETRSHGAIMKGREGLVYLIPQKYPDSKFLIGACAVECDFEMGFNYSYLVRAANRENIFMFKYNNELAPCEFNEAIVMPLKL